MQADEELLKLNVGDLPGVGWQMQKKTREAGPALSGGCAQRPARAAAARAWRQVRQHGKSSATLCNLMTSLYGNPTADCIIGIAWQASRAFCPQQGRSMHMCQGYVAFRPTCIY